MSSGFRSGLSHASITAAILRRCACAAALPALLALLAIVPAARAFDTGPHGDITRDALGAEGFGRPSADVVAVNNWFVDLYSQSEKVPHSGHAGVLKTLLGRSFLHHLLGRHERWSERVTHAAHRTHFDPVERLATIAGIEGEWDRLRRTTYLQTRAARDANDPRRLLTVMGISLHQVQDFYSHTNWVERRPPNGGDGPDWELLGEGGTPTWFDVLKSVRDQSPIQVAGAPGVGRGHGSWREDDNIGLGTAIAKDWPGRLFYPQAHMAAYFATRQWVRAIRAWVGDEAFWARAQRYAQRLGELRHDASDAFLISLYSGRWQGQGGPCTPGCDESSGQGGNLLSLRSAVKEFFEFKGPTQFRRTFEQVLPLVALPRPPLDLELARIPVASSRNLQASTAFVRLRVLHMEGLGVGGLGDPGPDDADMYSRAAVDGQQFHSAVIHSRDLFAFGQPYEPFTWLKSVRVGNTASQPVSSITVNVRTANERGSGTDDDVRLRLGPNLSFPLDKRVYDDFERRDHDTYSVPIDDATRAGLSVGDIRFVEIAKSSDGIGGAWKLGGLKLKVNGRVLYGNDRIERWLENDRRNFRAPDYLPSARKELEVSVWVELREDDDLYGGDDQGDINPFDARNALAWGYTPAPGPPLKDGDRGGHKLGGRLGKGGDKAFLLYAIDTLFPKPALDVPPPRPPRPPPPPPPPGAKPDLVISDQQPSANQVTIKNQGTATAGDFSVTVAISGVGLNSLAISGLAPSETETWTYASGCRAGIHEVRADTLSQVDESDETNNLSAGELSFC